MRVNEHEAPRNAALLFFSNDPVQWFRGARIDVVQFTADRAGDVQEERAFGGALVDQLRDCLNYLENFSAHHLQKQHDRSQVRGWVSYPLPALRETLVNAVYHRGYDVDQPEPTKVYLYPSRVEVISYPGPLPGIEPQHLAPDAQVPPVPARNRRIGEFLKELKLAEGRLSGLPKVFQAMEANGSPAPRFDFDEQRTYFRATLPAHPEYGALSALRDAAHLQALGQPEEAFTRIESAWASNPASAVLASEMIRLYAGRGEIGRAEEVLHRFETQGPENAAPHVVNVLIDVLMDAGERQKALRLLTQRRPTVFGQDAIDAAILARRAREDPQFAHRYFERAGDAVHVGPACAARVCPDQDLVVWHSSLATVANATRTAGSSQKPGLSWSASSNSIPHRRAAPGLGGNSHVRSHWLRAPVREVEDAYRKAIELKPDEPLFVQRTGSGCRRPANNRGVDKPGLER